MTGTSTSTPVRTQPRVGGPSGGSGYGRRVVVKNDDHNTFDHVIATFARVLSIPPQRAADLATEIHTRGRAVVWEGDVERAELIHSQLSVAGLTLEPLS
jgi:ATP-dependent Clp protease adaptor protein ClpS